MIGGRVLDTTALLDAATGTTAYTRAMLVVAGELGLVVVVPASALAEAWAVTDVADQPFLELLAGRSTVVVEALTDEVVAAVGSYAARGGEGRPQLGAAHAVHVAVQRGWPVLTAAGNTIRQMSAAVMIEALP